MAIFAIARTTCVRANRGNSGNGVEINENKLYKQFDLRPKTDWPYHKREGADDLPSQLTGTTRSRFSTGP